MKATSNKPMLLFENDDRYGDLCQMAQRKMDVGQV